MKTSRERKGERGLPRENEAAEEASKRLELQIGETNLRFSPL